MPEKNIVDDYYTQTNTSNQTDDTQNAKQKHQIKGKLKVKFKKENTEENNSQNQKTLEPKKSTDEKKQVSKPKKIWNSFANVVPKSEEFEANSNKKGYFTKKATAETEKKPFVKRQNDRPKDDNKSQDTKKPYTQTNSAPKEYNTKWGSYSTSSQTTGPSYEEKSKQQSANPSTGGGFAWGFKTTVIKKKTWFWSDNDFDSKKPKTFKKDKSNKHFKNTLLVEEDNSFSRSNKIKKQEKQEKKIEDIQQNLVSHAWETIVVPDILSVKELSEKIWVPLMKLITEFMKNWMKVTINSKIDYETASIIAETFDIKLQKDISSGFDVIDILDWNIQALVAESDNSVLVSRAPVISIMWHVDHGKTSLLDHIRHSKVADKEAWGITQSIWAYQVVLNNKKITFLDTPWHEAFTIMRARWAKSTDIAILVVAADEWVKPQTIESINHAREAWIPIVVAINKMDKEWANPEFVKWQLAWYWLQPEDWGWDTPMVPVSAKAWTWIDELLEIILLVAEMQELKANPNRQAVWTVIESHLDTKLWPVCTVLINTWTLNKWDSIVCKWAYWKVKVLKDYLWKNAVDAWPSTPVLVVWLDSVVEWWDIIQVVSDVEKARIKAIEYKELMASKKQAQASSIDLIMSKIKSWALKQLKIVLKSDSNWSLEALKWALIKLSTPETRVSIIHSWVWNVTEWDVLMCQWSKAILISFNVDLLWNTKNMIEDNKIELISSKVIYHITDKIEKIITWMLDPKEVEISLWEATVGWIFYEDKWFMILWLKIKADNIIQKNAQIRVIRKDKMMWKWLIENLKSWVIDVDMLEWPIECWIKFKSDVKVEIGDVLEIFKVEIQK